MGRKEFRMLLYKCPDLFTNEMTPWPLGASHGPHSHPSWRPPVLTTRVHFLPLGLLSVSVFTHHFVSLATVILSLDCSQVLIILPMISKADTCLNFHTSKNDCSETGLQTLRTNLQLSEGKCGDGEG